MELSSPNSYHILGLRPLDLDFLYTLHRENQDIKSIIIQRYKHYLYMHSFCFIRVPYLLKEKRNSYKITLLSVGPSVCLSVYLTVKTLHLRNAQRYRIEIQTIYILGSTASLFPNKKRDSIFTQKKDMALYIAKYAYFDTIKGIKIRRVLPVDLDL